MSTTTNSSPRPVYNGTNGFKINQSSFTVFGNNGSLVNSGSVTQSGNTALTSLGFSSSASSAVLTALTQTTDHLPVVADYSFTPASTPPRRHITATPASPSIITCGSTAFTFTVQNSASGANAFNFNAAAGTNVTGTVSGPSMSGPDDQQPRFGILV